MTSLQPPPPPPPPPPRRNAPPHSRKRPAETSLEHEQRLSKRFDLLNLDNTATRLYIPVPGSTDTTLPRPPSAPIPTPDPLAFTPNPPSNRARKPRAPPPSTTTASDTMEVEDTPHRVYIHNLDAELSDIESDEDTPIFLSDIEKHLAKIPRHVLLRPEPRPNEHNQVVLYHVPESLSVERERDGVRMAIVEARERIRERQGLGLGVGLDKVGEGGGGGLVQNVGGVEVNGMQSVDEDAMDID
ncbi:hypothetical protein NX059_003650 [Plenodomus lindquistii]|nr:hypothetical protein NX059_003650 [Plenodomus lindquistii]